MTAIHFVCPHCRATPGAKCVNYLKKPCAPHREREERARAATEAKDDPDYVEEETEAKKIQRSLFDE